MCKTRKGKIGLTLGILIPTLLIGTPIALLYGFFYDGSSSPVVKDETFSRENILDTMIYNSLQQAKTYKGLHLGLSEDKLNQLFLSAMDNLNETTKKYVGAPYIKIDSENRTFELTMHAQVPLFKTKVSLSGGIEFVTKSSENSDDGIKLSIKDIKIGRLGVGDFALGIASKFVNDQLINDTFKQAGISMTCSLENKTLFYSARDLMDDVVTKAGIDNIYLSMIDFAIEEKLLDISYSKECFGIKMDLKRTQTNELLDDANNSLAVSESILNYVNDVETLLNANIIEPSEVDLTLNYLTHGYHEPYASLSSKDLTSIGINDFMAHKGLNITTTTDITDVFNNQIENIDAGKVLTDKQLNIDFSESDFNETLKTSNIIGQSFNFNSLDEKGQYHVNAIFIDDFYVNFAPDKDGDNTINFIIGVNINGLSTKLIVTSKVKTIVGKRVEMEIKDIHYGEIMANEMMRKSCVDYVLQALTNISTWFEIQDGHLIFFDLDDCVNNMKTDPLKPETTLLKTALASSTLEAVTDSNKLSIQFKLN